MDPRTVRAAVLADTATFVLIGGSLWFLGMAPAPALIIGALLGGLMFLLVYGVSKRSLKLHGPDGPPHPNRTTSEDDRG